MPSARPNPFLLGMQHAEAGKSVSAACPYPKGSRERIRYVSGHHAGEARAAHTTPDPITCDANRRPYTQVAFDLDS